MLLRLGLIVYPLLAVVIIASRPGPVARFVKAGATSPERARRPRTVGIERPSLLSDHVRSGVLHRLADGRCYVDLPTMHRRRRRVIVAVAVTGVATLAAALLL